MLKFRACVGPSASKCHIVIDGVEPALTLCEKTTAARTVTGKVHPNTFCTTCLIRMGDKVRNAMDAGEAIETSAPPENQDGNTLMKWFADAIGVEIQ